MADKKPLLALNLGSQRVSLARFHAVKGGLALQDYASTELMADPAADSARVAQTKVAVAELVANLGVKKGTPVRYAISGHAVFSRFVKLPAMSDLDEDKIKELVEFEAKQNVPFPMDEVKWDYQLVSDGTDGGEIEAVIVALKSDAINELNDAVEDSGLVTHSVDIAPMALYNAFRYNYSDVASPSLIVDVGARTTNLVYVDGGRVFTRSLPEGGAAASSAIAKEFDVPFLEAESLKLADGFVSLGGNYADHEDPQVAAMSKVIRQTMTRLHANIVRTTSSYRQQGGNAPQTIYLCGGSASLPYLREFFMEKFDNMDVEYFNAVRNVSVGPKIDTEALGADAHNLGELVGLGLRGMSSCPMEIDLVPDALDRRRDVERRKPFLITTGACLLATLAATWLYFSKGESLAESRMAAIDERLAELRSDEAKIAAQERRIQAATEKANPLRLAVHGRTQLVEMIHFLNSQFPNERIWMTRFEPLSNGQPLEEAIKLWSGPDPSNLLPEESPTHSVGSGNTNSSAPKTIDAVRVYGLFRDPRDAEGSGQQVVFQLFRNIKENDPGYFALEDKSEADQVKLVESDPTTHARPFRIILPLKTPIIKPELPEKSGR